MKNFDIDFVILWVDGADPEWQKEKNHWSPGADKSATAANRFRDWDNLRYWFRSVEKCTPWVRKIHFVTCGHLPPWLKEDNPRLHIVKHSDYMPAEALPTFSCNPLELNMHRIPDLAEHFVYFNDDMFVLREIPRTFFFNECGYPCDRAIQTALQPDGSSLFGMRSADVSLINRHFSKRACWRQNWRKYLSFHYGRELYRNVALFPWEKFTGFYDDHLPIAYRKETLKNVWSEEFDYLQSMNGRRFRQKDDLTNWVFRYWQYAQGTFAPCAPRGKFIELSAAGSAAVAAAQISAARDPMVCLNDSDPVDFESAKATLISAFEKLFPEKSSFEK